MILVIYIYIYICIYIYTHMSIYMRRESGLKYRFGVLVIAKIIKISATRCHILRLKTRNSIPGGSPLYIDHTVSETNKQY